MYSIDKKYFLLIVATVSLNCCAFRQTTEDLLTEGTVNSASNMVSSGFSAPTVVSFGISAAALGVYTIGRLVSKKLVKNKDLSLSTHQSGSNDLSEQIVDINSTYKKNEI